MSGYSQANRAFRVKTPLGDDVLLLSGFGGREGISELFRFRLDLIAENGREIAFEQLIGKPMTVSYDSVSENTRYFSGIVRTFEETWRDDTFTYYSAEIVPSFWRLRKNVQSRIFQNKNVHEILEIVLADLPVAYRLHGTYPRHNYCVQYRESDYDFACRLMEEEGVFYFFEHADKGHTMVVDDASMGNPMLADQPKVPFSAVEHGRVEGTRIHRWSKKQGLSAGKVTLWDYTFQLPGKNLQAEHLAKPSFKVGAADHSLTAGDNSTLELFDHVGAYAHRFDGIGPGGENQEESIGGIFEENLRLARVRMEEEAVRSVRVRGESNCGRFTAGWRFSLVDHYNGNGDYLITRVDHVAEIPGYRAGSKQSLAYSNKFACIPSGMPFRPRRKTAVPQVAGPQTATVVGPAGEEIFTDKYGRVKVQFHWDRQGKNDARSSCWVRVAQGWAGKNWGHIQIPRVGQEVVITFLEGDPDAPLITGSVYNPAQMPPFELPANATRSGFKSHSRDGGSENFSGLVFEDKPGSEMVQLHSERDMITNAENNHTHNVARDHHQRVGRRRMSQVGGLTLKPHRGSGAGGADSDDLTSPISWSEPEVTGALGLSYELVIGETVDACVGWYGDYVIGSYVEVIINPGGVMQALGPAASTAIMATAAAVGGAIVAGEAAHGDVLGGLKALGWTAVVGATLASGGASTVVYGADNTYVYGPETTCHHGATFGYHSSLHGGLGVAVGLLAAATGASFAVATVLPAIMPDDQEDVLGELGMSGLNALLLAGLQWAEGSLNAAQAAAHKTQEAEDLAKRLIALPTFATQITTAAEDRCKVAIGMVGKAALGAAATASAAAAAATALGIANTHTVDGEYTINANNISLVGVTPMAALFEDLQPVTITLDARGTVADGTGSLQMMATSAAYINVGPASVAVKNTEDIGSVLLDCGTTGSIILQTGISKNPSAIEIVPTGVTIGSDLPIKILQGEGNEITLTPGEGINIEAGPACSIAMTPATMTLKCGVSTISFTDEGITISVGGSTLEIAPSGISIISSSIAVGADSELALTSSAVTIS